MVVYVIVQLPHISLSLNFNMTLQPVTSFKRGELQDGSPYITWPFLMMSMNHQPTSQRGSLKFQTFVLHERAGIFWDGRTFQISPPLPHLNIHNIEICTNF